MPEALIAAGTATSSDFDVIFDRVRELLAPFGFGVMLVTEPYRYVIRVEVVVRADCRTRADRFGGEYQFDKVRLAGEALGPLDRAEALARGFLDSTLRAVAGRLDELSASPRANHQPSAG